MPDACYKLQVKFRFYKDASGNSDKLQEVKAERLRGGGAKWGLNYGFLSLSCTLTKSTKSAQIEPHSIDEGAGFHFHFW